MKRSLVAGLIFITLSFGSFFGLILYSISDTPTDALIVHAIDSDASWVPGYAWIARWYLTSQRIPDTPKDDLCHGLHYALRGRSNDAAWEVADAFVDAGADIDCRVSEGGVQLPLLHSMILQGDVDKVEYVLSKGADPAVKIEKEGKTPDSKSLAGLNARDWTDFLSLQKPDKIKTYQKISTMLAKAEKPAP